MTCIFTNHYCFLAAPKSEDMHPVGSIMRSRMRRSDSSASPEFSAMVFGHQGGVVDECCKKQCTLSTLASYCANARDISNLNVQDILSPGSEIPPNVPGETNSEFPQVTYLLTIETLFISNFILDTVSLFLISEKASSESTQN